MGNQSDQQRRLQHLPKKRSRKALLLPIVVSVCLASVAASTSPITAYGASKSGVKVLADQALPSGYIADIYLPRSARLQRGRREDSLPLVVFLLGAFVDKSQYASVARLIAKEGFVVAAPNPFALWWRSRAQTIMRPASTACRRLLW